ncbi:MAG: 4Fe-4S dicluster domain-containing protein [Thermodesulfovibrionales bacterium]|nr:4Fe-4S dicluster domain-containing protein [Thermodesulfovibrionales bacterium]
MMQKKFDFDKLEIELPDSISKIERRKFLKMGFAITGLLLGGKILSLTSVVDKGYAFQKEKYPYKPHYSMLIYQNRCIDCELCMEACSKTNQVPSYGYRTTILQRKMPQAIDQQIEFIPVLCNQCNRPPCVTGCPTRATYKDKRNGIVMMINKKCIGCKTCMTACPYNARYYNEEKHAVDKCDFCYGSRLSKGLTTTACAEVCPAGVRIFGDLSDPNSEIFRMVHQLERTIWVLRPESGAAPNVFYTRG